MCLTKFWFYFGIFYIFGQLFNIVNGQILKNNPAISSRCTTAFTNSQWSNFFFGILRVERSPEIGLFKTSFPLFSSFQCNFNTVDSTFKFCWWLDWKCGSLVSEATALPTEPQPLPKLSLIFKSSILWIFSFLFSISSYFLSSSNERLHGLSRLRRLRNSSVTFYAFLRFYAATSQFQVCLFFFWHLRQNHFDT